MKDSDRDGRGRGRGDHGGREDRCNQNPNWGRRGDGRGWEWKGSQDNRTLAERLEDVSVDELPRFLETLALRVAKQEANIKAAQDRLVELAALKVQAEARLAAAAAPAPVAPAPAEVVPVATTPVAAVVEATLVAPAPPEAPPA